MRLQQKLGKHPPNGEESENVEWWSGVAHRSQSSEGWERGQWSDGVQGEGSQQG